MAPASLHLKPKTRADPAHARNLDANATRQIRMVYPQAIPSFSKPRLVFKPDKVKYYMGEKGVRVEVTILGQRRTMGRRRIDTRSSIFSTRAMANPFSCGMMSPARKPPAKNLSSV